jgi:hypothetical protein
VDYIHRQLEIAEDYFREYDCFAGMAIHYYKTFGSSGIFMVKRPLGC